MKNKSIWLESSGKARYEKLNEDIDVDVLIVGGGITGLSCCYHLIGSDLRVALVEANRLYHGVTSKTTGKLTYLQGDIYSKITSSVSIDAAKLYYESQKHAIDLVKNIIEDNKINCNFEKSDSYLFTNEEKKISIVQREGKLLEEFGGEFTLEDKIPLNNVSCRKAVRVDDCFVFHPLKYLDALVKIIVKNGIDVYENSRILSIDEVDGDYFCKTKNHTIKAKKVVLALHYPYFLKPFFFPLKVSLEKSYVGASLVEKDLGFNAINVDDQSKSIRYHKDSRNMYQLFLYGSRNICLSTDDLEHFDCIKELPFKFEYLWSNIDIITSDSLPYIGEIKKNLLLATGYNTWGMTNGSLAGEVIKDLILGKVNHYGELFDPLRGMNKVKLPFTIGSSIKGFGEGFRRKAFNNNSNLTFTSVAGKKVAIYKDSLGEEHIVYIKCPHLKCDLIFNELELTWDCPCHGSRFDIDGKCIEGPSNYDISVEHSFLDDK